MSRDPTLTLGKIMNDRAYRELSFYRTATKSPQGQVDAEMDVPKTTGPTKITGSSKNKK